MPIDPILPPQIRISAAPGETITQDFVVQSRLPRGALIATVEGDASIIRLREFVAYRKVRYRVPDDEFVLLPPHLQDEAHRWEIRFEVASRAGDGEPLSVSPGDHVTGILEFIAPSGVAPNHYRATLIVSGGRRAPVEVPVLFVVGEIRIESARPIELHQNLWTPVQFNIALTGAPETDITIAVTGGYLDAPATRVRVPAGRSATATLAMHVSDNVPLGPLASMLTITGHSQKLNFVPITVQVKRPLPPPPTLDRPAAVQKIHQEYMRSGGAAGRLGFPTTKVQFNDNTATRFYRGGRIEARLADGPIGVVTQAITTHKAVVTLLGIRCIKESDHDQLSDTDEPYFVVGIDNARGEPIVQKLGPFENTETGTEIGSGAMIIIDNLSPNPLSIRVAAFEKDEGDPDETARKLQEKMVELARAAQSIAGASGAEAADGPGVGPTATAGAVGALAGPLGSLLAVGIVQLLGLGDDYIGQDSQVLYAKPELVGQDPPRLGSYRGQDYNVMLDIDGRGEGHYQLFFAVDGRTIDEN